MPVNKTCLVREYLTQIAVEDDMNILHGEGYQADALTTIGAGANLRYVVTYRFNEWNHVNPTNQ